MKGRKRGTKKLEASTDANKTDVTVQKPVGSPNNSESTAVKPTKRSASSENNDGDFSPKKLRERKEPPKEERSKSSGGKQKNTENAKAKQIGREYEVEAIVNKRNVKGVEEFLIKWKGYSAKENSWVPKKNLNCRRLLDEFLKNKK